MGTGYYHILMLSFVSHKNPKEGMMASFKKSLEDKIEMAGVVATNSVSIETISCPMEKRRFDGGSLCKV